MTRPIRLALAACILLAGLPLAAQSSAPRETSATVPALFLSDIHFDPYHDPAKVRRLNAAPVAEWRAILAEPDSPTQQHDYDALHQTCPVGGIDTSNDLWQSSLHAIHAHAAAGPAPVQFVTVSGDLLGHYFDCKYKTLLPTATHAEFLAFAEKTIHYIVNGMHDALPGIPIYIALGNDDSGCTDYSLDPAHDEFLALTAKTIAESLPASLSAADRQSVLTDFAAGGYYSAPLPAVIPNTRLLVLDDIFLSAKYATCSGQPDPAPGAAQLAWLSAQLSAARARHEHVWVLGHIPPSVDLYATARHLTNICGGAAPSMFLGSERLAEIIAANADVVRLALFGHTHSDEIRLLTRTTGDDSSSPVHPVDSFAGVALKQTASIASVNRNRPSFTLASIDPSTATLVDYSVIIASNLTGVAATWSKEYTYSSTYHEPAFSPRAVAALIEGFQADPEAKTPASQAYLRNFFPGDVSPMLQLAWPQYTCSLNHDSAKAFAACACANINQKPQPTSSGP